jgi:hypothetical protein
MEPAPPGVGDAAQPLPLANLATPGSFRFHATGPVAQSAGRVRTNKERLGNATNRLLERQARLMQLVVFIDRILVSLVGPGLSGLRWWWFLTEEVAAAFLPSIKI